jgi:hypothetical protein
VKSTDPSVLPNTGVRASIEVQNFSMGSACVSFWISDDTPGNIWGQIGWYICNNDAPVAFYQIWNLNTNQIVGGGTGPIANGIHSFQMSLTSGTTWSFVVDGISIGSYNMGSSVSSSTYPIYSMSEENTLPSPVPIPLVLFPVAIQAQVGGSWNSALTASAYVLGGSWGLQGPDQNIAIPQNSFALGDALSTPANGATVW